jgi:hypothetical protein
LRSRNKLARALTLGLGMLCVVPLSESLRAETKSAFPFEQLRDATDLVVMIIPSGTSFRSAVTPDRLPQVACVYQMRSGPGSTQAKMIDMLEESLIEFRKAPMDIHEVRIGLFFRTESGALPPFYFDDWGGAHNIRGGFGEYWLLASAGMPDRLRGLLTGKDVVYVENGHSRCPQTDHTK